MEDQNIIGEIALCIANSGLKKKYIAALIGITDTELSHLLSGKRRYPEAIKKLKKLFKIKKS